MHTHTHVYYIIQVACVFCMANLIKYAYLNIIFMINKLFDID